MQDRWKPEFLILVVLVLGSLTREAATQIRKVPEASRGGRKYAELWEKVPLPIRSYPFPEFPIPKTLEEWKQERRDNIHKTVIQCLGEIPPRPRDLQCKVTEREERDTYILEHFVFDNEVDGAVTGYLMIPRNERGNGELVRNASAGSMSNLKI